MFINRLLPDKNMNINLRSLGMLLIAFSIILMFLLTFIKVDNDKKSIVLCQKFEKENLDMNSCPAHKSNFSWLIIVAYGLVFVMMVVGLYIVMVKEKPGATKAMETSEHAKEEFAPVDISKMDEEEKTIYEIIKNKGGSAYQTDLIRETSFSKVKVTRILDKMELKKIIERKRRGMTNLVVLK